MTSATAPTTPADAAAVADGWQVTLPGHVTEGDTTHVSVHNTVIDAAAELRTVVDALTTRVTAAEKTAADAKTAADKATTDLTALTVRVKALEDAGSSKSGT